MAQIDDVTSAIHAAREATAALMNILSICLSDQGDSVHVRRPRDLEQVPGEATTGPFNSEYNETAKVYDEVRFFCLTKAEQEGLG
jgi:hypothetical protein